MLGLSGLVLGLVLPGGLLPAVGPPSSDTASPVVLPPVYEEILADPLVVSVLVWESSAGARRYAEWEPVHRADLARVLRRLEREGEPHRPDRSGLPDRRVDRPLEGAPRGALDEATAWSVFLDHVGHTLWLEAGRRVPWSLRSMTPDQLSLLLDGRELFAFAPDTGRYRFGPAGSVADPDPVLGHRFVLREDLLRPSQEETVWAVASWMRTHVGYPPEPSQLHGSGAPERSMQNVLSGMRDGSPPLAGCHEVSGVLAAFLRSVNVPVAVRRDRFAVPGGPVTEHSRVELPTLGRGLVDASILGLPLLRPSGNVVPTPALFPTLGWVTEHVDRPRELLCDESSCHRYREQAFYNVVRRALDLAITHLPDGLLILRVDDADPPAPAPRLAALLSGRLATWDGAFLAPFFDEPLRREIVRRVDEEIERTGDGDWHRGAERIRRRYLSTVTGPEQEEKLGEALETPLEPIEGF